MKEIQETVLLLCLVTLNVHTSYAYQTHVSIFVSVCCSEFNPVAVPYKVDQKNACKMRAYLQPAPHCIKTEVNVFVNLTVSLCPALQALLQLNPYHIDSLLQLSDVCRIQEDQEMARDLIGEIKGALPCHKPELLLEASRNTAAIHYAAF